MVKERDLSKLVENKDYVFCNFLTSYAGRCGVAVFDGKTRCKTHRGRKNNRKIDRAPKRHGFSSHRAETGEWQ